VGNFQLLQYERVRNTLRKGKGAVMHLLLTQIKKFYRTPFPPIYKDLTNVSELKQNMYNDANYLE
jgi:hypothetical protein